jgi:hypothetical protein
LGSEEIVGRILKMWELTADDVEVHERVQVPGGRGCGRIRVVLSRRRSGDGGISGKVGLRGGWRRGNRSRLGVVEALIEDLGSSSLDFCSEIGGSEVEGKT